MIDKLQYALVTGGTDGLRHLTEVLAEEGYNLIVVVGNAARFEGIANEIKEKCSVKVIVIEGDLSDSAEPWRIQKEIKELDINISLLANIIIGSNDQSFVQTDLQKQMDIVQCNIMAFIALAKLFLPDMVQRRNGKIISVAPSDKVHSQLSSLYRASIAFLDSFMATVKIELEDTGVSMINIRSGRGIDNVFGKTQKLIDKTLDRWRSLNKTNSNRDGYESFMRGD